MGVVLGLDEELLIGVSVYFLGIINGIIIDVFGEFELLAGEL